MIDSKEFEKMANEYTRKLIEQQDKYFLSQLNFENLVGLYNLVVAEMQKRIDEGTKEKWKDAKTVKIGEIDIKDYK